MAQFNVMVVDDAALIRDLVKKSVRTQFPNWTVSEAVNGRKAQSMLKTHAYDLVLCDWEMPEMSGTELLQWVREQGRYQNLPFILITSRGDRDHVVEAVKIGVSEYLVKPFSNAQLLGKIVKALTKHGISPETALAARPQLSGASSMGSIDALTRNVAKPAAAPNGAATGSSDALVRPSAPAATATPGDHSKAIIPVRFAELAVQCAVKRITLNEVVGVFMRGDTLPQLLEGAVVDILSEDGQDVARINGYVHSLTANEPSMNSRLINIIIRFVDQDPVKMEQLTYFIASRG